MTTTAYNMAETVIRQWAVKEQATPYFEPSNNELNMSRDDEALTITVNELDDGQIEIMALIVDEVGNEICCHYYNITPSGQLNDQGVDTSIQNLFGTEIARDWRDAKRVIDGLVPFPESGVMVVEDSSPRQ